MKDDPKQIDDKLFWSGNPRKITIHKTSGPIRPYKLDKPRLSVLIGDEQQGLGGVVDALIKEDFQDQFDVRSVFSRSVKELKKAFEAQAFDFVVLNLTFIRFPSESVKLLSPEHRQKLSLELVRHFGKSSRTPLIALNSWGGSEFEKQLTDVDYTFEPPGDINELREAIKSCLKNNIEAKLSRKQEAEDFIYGVQKILNVKGEANDDQRKEKQLLKNAGCSGQTPSNEATAEILKQQKSKPVYSSRAAPEITVISENECVNLFDRLESLKREIGSTPEALIQGEFSNCDRDDLFDVNRFFEVFDKLKPEAGYTLDYYYVSDFDQGSPYVYVRRMDSESIKINSQNELNKFLENYDGRLKHIEIEKSAYGYFQRAVFDIAVHQFYLQWHALYNETSIITSKKGIGRITQGLSDGTDDNCSDDIFRYDGTVTKGNLKELKRYAPAPVVKMHENKAVVRLVTFHPWMNSLYRRLYYISSNNIERVKDFCLLTYEPTLSVML